MDGYHVALFVHLCAVFGAFFASAIVHVSVMRRIRARTVHEALEWHLITTRWSKMFPAALLTLVLSGSYMISAGALQVWSSGFVITGLVGFVLLLAIGMTLSAKGRVLKGKLEEVIANGGGDQPPRVAPDRVAATLMNIPTGVVLAVAFVMTTKPALATALTIVAGAMAVVIGMSLRQQAAMRATMMRPADQLNAEEA